MKKFEASAGGKRQDFDTAEGAIAFVEAAESGSVVLFAGRPNDPGRWPDIVWNSRDLWSLENGIWRSHYIYGGTGEVLAEERPH